MLQSLPQAVAAAMDARRDLGQDESGALPGGELISDDVQASISNNSFEDIMEAIRNERHYSDISAEDVMRCIPRGLILHPTKMGWLSCWHCSKNGKFLEFPNDIGVKHHFARGGAHNPSDPPPPPGSSSMASGDAPAPPAPTQDAPPQLPLPALPEPALLLVCPLSPQVTPPRSLGLPLQSGASGYLPSCSSTLQGPSNWSSPFPRLTLLTFLPCLPCGTASQQTAIQRFPGLRVYTASPPQAG